jgi:lipopolysaccharide transport system permease protein
MSSPVTSSDKLRQEGVPREPLSSTMHLPSQQPLITIENRKSWIGLNLRELWHYRELLYFLTWRDVKVRYKQTIIGVLWVVLQPLLTTIIFTIFLGKLARVPSDGLPYALFAYAGLLPWTFFSMAITTSGNSLVGSAHLITKVYFPRMIIPAAAVAARLLDLAIAFVILVAFMIYYGVSFSWHILLLPPLVLLLSFLALAVGMWISATNVKYRDVGVALPVLVQFWMFASPIVYSSSLVYSSKIARGWKVLYSLNPLVGVIDNFRAALFGTAFNWPGLGMTIVLTVVMLVYGAYDFRRMERNFADIV